MVRQVGMPPRYGFVFSFLFFSSLRISSLPLSVIDQRRDEQFPEETTIIAYFQHSYRLRNRNVVFFYRRRRSAVDLEFPWWG
jgi:hypothetical protein